MKTAAEQVRETGRPMNRQEAERVVREALSVSWTGWGLRDHALAALDALTAPQPLHPTVVRLLEAVRALRNAWSTPSPSTGMPSHEVEAVQVAEDAWADAGYPGLEPAPEVEEHPFPCEHCGRPAREHRADGGCFCSCGEVPSPQPTAVDCDRLPGQRAHHQGVVSTSGLPAGASDSCDCPQKPAIETVTTRHRIVVLADGETWEQIAPPTWDAAVYVVDLNNEEFERIHKGNESVQDVVNLKERGKRVI